MRLIPLQTLTSVEICAWTTLSERALEPNPFFEPAFVLAAHRTLDVGAADLLVCEKEGTWLGCMPVRRTRLMGLPIALSTWKHPYSVVGTPLVDRDRLGEFADDLVSGLRSLHGGRYLMLRRSIDGPVIGAIRSAMERSGKTAAVFERTEQRAALERRQDPDSYLVGMKSRRRKDLNRKGRQLAEAVGGDLTTHDRAGSEDAVEEFLRLEAGGWKGEAGTAMGARSGDAELFRSLCTSFAEFGRLQLLALEAEGKAIAMQCNIGAGDTLFSFKVAFDESLRRYGPGVQLELSTIRIFHEDRAERIMDSCADPGNEMINRLWPDRLSVVTLMLGPSGPSGWAVRRVLDAAYAIRTRKKDG